MADETKEIEEKNEKGEVEEAEGSLGMIIVAILLFFTWNVWVDLTEETISQLNNEDYNRVLAYNYYLFEANNNWITTVLGNGLLSTRVTSQMYDLWEAGIVNSDVGFIGYWNQLGLIPIFVFFVVIIKALVAKTCPFFVKALGAHILGGALTMSYFGDPSTILWFSLFYYLFVYYTRINNSQYNLCYNKCLS